MNSIKTLFDTVRDLLTKIPSSWVELTTHRLDIYNEPQAKSEFLSELKNMLENGKYSTQDLDQLPTAYDYIRLGHQLSSVLEWVLAEVNDVNEDQVITFASQTMPILSILRKNLMLNQMTHIYYDADESPLIDESRLKRVYGYQYQLHRVQTALEIAPHEDGSVVFITQKPLSEPLEVTPNIDISINAHARYGCAMVIHNADIDSIIGDVQHVRRRETIAMTPSHCLSALREMVNDKGHNERVVNSCIQANTGSSLAPLIASSGLSIQYAILMGLVENALTEHPEKDIKIILPPNCYGGTNDQSRRIADMMPKVGIVDLLVDGGEDLVNSLDDALSTVAACDAVPIVLAEIPTNPRVEVPDMDMLAEVLSVQRKNNKKELAVAPVFMVDQTFCPNVKLLHDESELNAVKVISFSSGSKFPSGGRCVAGYCAANVAAKDLMPLISSHLQLSDNFANADQLQILAESMPSMPDRIVEAYQKTREFVNNIQTLLPQSKIFYVSDDIAKQGFMPSVFSLDLPTQGESEQQRIEFQKQLNKKLIKYMIETHPDDCKNCVSYGQLKGSYWTIPATSTQGTTKEADKDYVVRASVSPTTDVEQLSQSFKQFCLNEGLID